MKLQRNQSRKLFELEGFRFSVSSVKSYRQCGLKFYREKVEKLKPEKESTHHRWLGRVVHNAIYHHVAVYNVNEEGLKTWNLIEDGDFEHSPLSSFNAMWEGVSEDAYLDSLIKGESGKRPENFIKKKKFKSLNTDNQEELQEAWKVEAEKMVLNGAEVLNKVHKINKIEYKLEFKFMDYDFVGYIDILAEDEKGRVEYYDFKTSWAKPSENKLTEDMQFLLYSYGLKTILNLDYYPVGHLVHLRSGALVTLHTEESYITAEKERFAKDLNWLENNVFYKNMYDVLCPYCDFYKLCYGEEPRF